MRKATFILFAVGITVLFQSCENKSLDQELNEYCECQKKSLEGERSAQECMELANEISDKYQFDPEAATKIQEKIKNCSAHQ